MRRRAIYRSQAGEDAGSLQPLHDRVLVDGPRVADQERAEPASR